jgi:hypothetical protein
MSFARRQFASVFVFSVLSLGASAQTIADETGLTALRARLGTGAVPTGAGVVCGQVEAPAPGWAPDTLHAEFVGKTFTLHSPSPSISGHATVVGQFYYGLVTGISPGMTDVHCWEALNWLGAGFLNGTGSVPPLAAPFKVLNNSWIGAVGNSNLYLRKLDFAIDAQGLLVCSGVNNGTGPLDVPLLSHSYNGIACGRSDGQHHAGGTLVGIDGQGRMKPEIVAPAGATSFSTPLVAGACSLLVETARTWPTTSANPDAQRPEVIKAALLAGANHRTGWTNGPAASGPTRGATMKPIDPLYGCDQVDVDTSHWIVTAGEQPSGSDVASAALVPPQGWEMVATAAATSRYWRFRVERPKSHVSVVAAWNRHTTANFGAFSVPDHDLELWSVDPANNTTALVGTAAGAYFGDGNVASTSLVDNVEHLYVRDLQPGDYVLELRRLADALGSWDVAVAWEFACEDPLAYGTGKITSLGQEARLSSRGVPSEAGADFHLVVSSAIPNANGVAFWGLAQASVPFHGGTRWVATPVARLGISQCDPTGALDLPLAIDPTMPGQTRYYQYWFRDPAHPDGTGAGLTNAVAVGFCR